MYRIALAALIERDGRFHVAAHAANDPDAVRAVLDRIEVQLVVVDFEIDGREIDALEAVLDVVAPRAVLVLTTSMDASASQRVMRRGAAGIVFKSSGGDVLLAAIDAARRGQVWLDRSVLPQMFDPSEPRSTVIGDRSRIAQLTPREREIMAIACTGVTNKQIASRLSISEATVRHHLGSIFSKLGVSTRSELVVFGYRHNLASAV